MLELQEDNHSAQLLGLTIKSTPTMLSQEVMTVNCITLQTINKMERLLQTAKGQFNLLLLENQN